MKDLIAEIEGKIAAAAKLEVTAFRDMAIGALHSAIHGLRSAEENLGWHQVKMAEKAKAGTMGPLDNGTMGLANGKAVGTVIK